MKTIAISIDEATLAGLDRLAQSSLEEPPRSRPSGGGRPRTNRSRIVRLALREYLALQEKSRSQRRERLIFAKHRRLISRQAEALVGEQAVL